MPETAASSTGAPTYGEFIRAAAAAVDRARLITGARFPDADTAHTELLGYERFLHVAGSHLKLLDDLARTNSTPRRRLAAYLARLPQGTVNDGRWYDAARTLATAHDLVATHLGRHLIARTPQAEELLAETTADPAVREVARLVMDAAIARKPLLSAAKRAQRRLACDARPASGELLTHLHRIGATVEVYTKAALWELDQDPSAQHRDVLTGLEPATRLVPAAPSARFKSSLAALKMLRQASYVQAHGNTDASPASLRDLALLGVRYTGPDARTLPEASSGLERLQCAHATDMLNEAHFAWRRASEGLTVAIQGVTTAPGAYGAAVNDLLRADLPDSTLHRAVIAALPQLGREACRTIRVLGRSGGLVTRQRGLDQRVHWRPMPDVDLAELSDRFEAAVDASARARDVAQQLATVSTQSTGRAFPSRTRTRHRVTEQRP
ncbi:MAG TPA: hypothetical protein VFI97_07980 [Arthrobacter sp.]|nr:hypothetical protein [Arthrobacter sp.]